MQRQNDGAARTARNLARKSASLILTCALALGLVPLLPAASSESETAFADEQPAGPAQAIGNGEDAAPNDSVGSGQPEPGIDESELSEDPSQREPGEQADPGQDPLGNGEAPGSSSGMEALIAFASEPDASPTVSSPVANALVPADAIASGECGTCTWWITAEGALVITPTDGTSGTLDWTGHGNPGSPANLSPWTAYAASIKTAAIEKNVAAGRSAAGMFALCSSLERIEGLENLDVSNTDDFSYMFIGCAQLTALDLSSFSTVNATTTKAMFAACSNLTSIDFSGWDTATVNNSDGMFSQCNSLTELSLGASFTLAAALPTPSGEASDGRVYTGKWVAASSKKTYFAAQIPLGKADAYTAEIAESNVPVPDGVQASGIAGSCVWWITAADDPSNPNQLVIGPAFGEQGLLDLSDEKPWDDMTDLIETVSLQPGIYAGNSTASWFYDCPNINAIFGLDNVDTANVTTMESMFEDCTNLTSIEGIDSLNTANVQDMSNMFAGCSSLKALDISGWDTTNAIDCSNMFAGCSSVRTLTIGEKSLSAGMSAPVPSGDAGDGKTFTGRWIAQSDGAAYEAHELPATPDTYTAEAAIGNTAPDNVQGSGIAGSCLWWVTKADDPHPNQLVIKPAYGTLGSLRGESPWRERYSKTIESVLIEEGVGAGSSTDCLFFNCSNLTEINGLEHLDTSQVTNMDRMFAKCTSLKTLDLSALDASNVVSASSTFAECSALETIVLPRSSSHPAGKTPFSQLKDSYYLFWRCTSLTSIVGIEAFGAAPFASMTGMFSECSSLTELDLSTWNTTSASDMNHLFEKCSSLRKVTLGENFSFTGNGKTSCTLPTPYGLAPDGSALTGTWLASGSDVELSADDITDPGTYTAHTVQPETFGGCLWWITSKNAMDNPYRLFIAPAPGKNGELSVTDAVPWASKAPTIESVSVLDGVVTTGSASGLFAGCTAITELDLSGWDTTNASDMTGLFDDCTALLEVALGAKFSFSGAGSTACVLPAPSGKASSDERYTGKWQSLNRLSQVYAPTDVPSETADTYRAHSVFISGENGTCSWRITDEDELLIAPTNGTSGTLSGSVYFYFPWHAGAQFIKTVTIAPGVKVGKVAESLFQDCSEVTRINGLENLDTSETTNMGWMFASCSALTDLDLSALDTGKATTMQSMFENCTNLASLNLSSFDTKNVSNMNSMFANTGLTRIELGGSFSLAGNGSASGILPTPLGEAPDGLMYSGNWIASDKTVYAPDNLPPNTADTYTAQAVQASGTCGTCTWWITAEGELVITPTDGASGTLASDDLYFPWYDAAEQITAVTIDPGVSTGSTAESLFDGCSNLERIEGLENLDTSEAASMAWMFQGCAKLATLDLRALDTTSVMDMASMFAGCTALQTLDVSGWDTGNVQDMCGMFEGCTSLESADLSHFNTTNVADMSSMFQDCASLTAVNVSGFAPASNARLRSMFSGCSSLTSLDLSRFDVSNVSIMVGLFDGCTSLASLDLSGWEASASSAKTDLFGRDESLCANLVTVTADGAFFKDSGSHNYQLPTPTGGTRTGAWIAASDSTAYASSENFPQGTTDTYRAEIAALLITEISFDYQAETILVPGADIEVSTTSTFTAGTVVNAPAPAAADAPANAAPAALAAAAAPTAVSLSSILSTKPTTVFLRYAEGIGTGSPRSTALEVAVPARGETPVGLSSTNATALDTADGTVTGLTGTMEYRLGAQGAWTKAPDNGTVSGLAASTTVQVRTRAVEPTAGDLNALGAFASLPVEFKIGSDAPWAQALAPTGDSTGKALCLALGAMACAGIALALLRRRDNARDNAQ